MAPRISAYTTACVVAPIVSEGEARVTATDATGAGAGAATVTAAEAVMPSASAEIVANTVWRTLRPVLDQIAAS